MTPIALIVGLGNPGPEYADTRHNAGFWFADRVAEVYGARWSRNASFNAECARASIETQSCWLCKPMTYMNHSGRAVGAVSRYYQIEPAAILIVHDEMDFEPGVVRLKQDGGPGGNNGLRDVIAQLGATNFLRLRIGVGRPTDSRQWKNYLLHRPPNEDRTRIEAAIEAGLKELPCIVAGDAPRAMNALNRRSLDAPSPEGG